MDYKKVIGLFARRVERRKSQSLRLLAKNRTEISYPRYFLSVDKNIRRTRHSNRASILNLFVNFTLHRNRKQTLFHHRRIEANFSSYLKDIPKMRIAWRRIVDVVVILPEKSLLLRAQSSQRRPAGSGMCVLLLIRVRSEERRVGKECRL